jgi:uncharacterized protein YjbI with pentapeptide repeats
MTTDAPQEQKRTCDFRVTAEEQCGLDLVSPEKTKCIFHQYHGIAGETPKQGVVSEYIRQSLLARPGGPIYLSEMEFEHIRFDDSLVTYGIGFTCANAIFRNCGFHGLEIMNADFSPCAFHRTSFYHCKFRGGRADFRESTFDDADYPFFDCEFRIDDTDEANMGLVDFSNTIVRGSEQLFYHSRVTAPCFTIAEARLEVDNFKLLLDNSGESKDWEGMVANGCTLIHMNGLVVKGHFSIRQRAEDQTGYFLSFVETDFNAMRSAQLLHVQLPWAQFLYANLESVRFVGCVWPQKAGYTHILDETLCLGDIKKWTEIERLYGQLKRNFEKNGSYADAGHWHYREMEARRKVLSFREKSPWMRWLRFNVISFEAWYKYVSDYGESYVKPLLWIAGMYIGFAVLYSLTGVKVGDELKTHGLSDISIGALYSLYVMTLQFGKSATATNPFGHFLSLFQLLLTAIIVPLFLLAVRRKFRR